MAIANVSLVISYRSNFTSEMNKGGIDGLLKALQDKNHRLEKAPPAATPSPTDAAVNPQNEPKTDHTSH